MRRRDFFHIIGSFSAGLWLPILPQIAFPDELKIIKAVSKIEKKMGSRYRADNVLDTLAKKENYNLLCDLINDYISEYEHYKNNRTILTFELQSIDEIERGETPKLIEIPMYAPRNLGIEKLLNNIKSTIYNITGISIKEDITIKKLKKYSIADNADSYAKILTALVLGATAFKISRVSNTEFTDLLYDTLLPAAFGFFMGTGLSGLKANSIYGGIHESDSIKVSGDEDHLASILSHEIGHEAIKLSGKRPFYGPTIEEGIATGIQKHCTKAIDETYETNYGELDVLLMLGYMLDIYEHLKTMPGLNPVAEVEESKRWTLGINSWESYLLHDCVGVVAIQLLEKEHGKDIYKELLRGEDRHLQKLVYGK